MSEKKKKKKKKKKEEEEEEKKKRDNKDNIRSFDRLKIKRQSMQKLKGSC